jgi:hypothetical protein
MQTRLSPFGRTSLVVRNSLSHIVLQAIGYTFQQLCHKLWYNSFERDKTQRFLSPTRLSNLYPYSMFRHVSPTSLDMLYCLPALKRTVLTHMNKFYFMLDTCHVDFKLRKISFLHHSNYLKTFHLLQEVPHSHHTNCSESFPSYFTSLECEDSKWQATPLLQACKLLTSVLGLSRKFETMVVLGTMKATIKYLYRLGCRLSCSFIVDGLAVFCVWSHYMFRPIWPSSGV